MFEILIPLVLIIVLLMCMMNNNTDEDSFSVGGPCNRKIGEGFTPGYWSKPSDSNSDSNTGKDQCKVTMVWADWCGFSKKAKPEWDKLVNNPDNKVIDGCDVTYVDAEEKVSPDIIKKFKTTGFPTYYCELEGSPAVEQFNSITEDDMLDKIKKAIIKLKSNGEGFNVGGQPNGQPKPQLKPQLKPKSQPKPQPKPQPNNAQRFNTTYDKVRPTVEGEILFSSCEDSEYGPVRLDAVDRNLAGVGNAPQDVLGHGDCTELEFAPDKFSTGGPQIPSMNSLMPTAAQLKAPSIDSVQGIIRPSSFGSPLGANDKGNA